MFFHKIYSDKKTSQKSKKKFFHFFSKIECSGINQWDILADGAVDTTVMEEVMEEF
jgi:hypothetical protein